ncbi:hypothetical protein IVB08_06490 [Bradyrhizobium sp. 173]|uniref:hypothetical protein n=1 Tax=unclassified Bradyrhizobium TaxID=2631580 RepID=UPI001FF7FE5B|nr:MULTISPECIES: hypothetical protein [unclassified Bradyrhizobium]MCK1322931.1 hypothetical protein [Bradyrhizobium sp. 156]MCK1563626.1 hypothetical protein [Bradyrhizobium sp. 173]
MIKRGWIVIFESDKTPRYPSAVIHETYEKAKAFFDKRDHEGTPIAITEVDWDDRLGRSPWP